MTVQTLTSIVRSHPTHSDGLKPEERGSSKAIQYDFSEMRLSPCFALNKHGLVVNGTPSITEWLSVGEKLRGIERHIQFAIGDWLNYGERTYGEMYSQALEETSYAQRTLEKYAWVARSVETSLRREVLPFSYHEEVAALKTSEGIPDKEAQRNWLDKAAKGNGEKPWSVATLRAAIKDSRGKKHPDWLCFTDVWNFTACDERFGVDYPGRIPGQIVLNLLWRYTKEGELVVDPMAGGGVTLDACKELKRRCLSLDTMPIREDIQQSDATKEWPLEELAQLVFIDPPYWSQMEEDYGGMATKPYADFLTDMHLSFEQAHKHLSHDGKLAVLIAPMAIKTEYTDTPFDFIGIASELGFKLIRRISVPVSSQQVGPRVMEHCRDNGILVALLRDLLVFQKTSGNA